MKGFTLLSAVALTTTVLAGVAAAQRSVPSAELTEETAHTFTVDPKNLRVYRAYIGSDFQPASGADDPYVYLQTMAVRWSNDGNYALSYVSLATTTTTTRGDDVVLLGGPQVDPPAAGYSLTDPVACISEIVVLLVNAGTADANVPLTVSILPWNGLFGAGASPTPIFNTSATIALPANSLVFVSVDVKTINNNRLPVPKAFWVRLSVPAGTPGTIGWIIGNSTPGNVSMLPGRGYFRTDPTATGGSVFTGLPQGSFFMAIRGTHNFVGTIDLSRLVARAQPSDPLAFEFDDDPPGDPDEGIEEALRRNLVDVEVVNDSGPTPFTSRFTTYLDENGRFTLPVTSAVQSITVRRWDNGLAVRFDRPASGWNTIIGCAPTELSATMTFGDVNGDGCIDDADLLEVLFNFGTGCGG